MSEYETALQVTLTHVKAENHHPVEAASTVVTEVPQHQLSSLIVHRWRKPLLMGNRTRHLWYCPPRVPFYFLNCSFSFSPTSSCLLSKHLPLALSSLHTSTPGKFHPRPWLRSWWLAWARGASPLCLHSLALPSASTALPSVAKASKTNCDTNYLKDLLWVIIQNCQIKNQHLPYHICISLNFHSSSASQPLNTETSFSPPFLVFQIPTKSFCLYFPPIFLIYFAVWLGRLFFGSAGSRSTIWVFQSESQGDRDHDLF